MKRLLLSAFFSFAFVQAAVQYVPAKKLWLLETDRTSYVLGVNELNAVQHVYWGKKLTGDEDFTAVRTAAAYAFESREGMTNEEYPGWGGMRYSEPCLKVDRLRIQEGFSFAYAPKVMMAWVTDVPNMNGRSTPLKYRFLVSMMGSLGIGANLNHWTAEDFDLAKKMIAYYKSIRGAVQQGKLYRLSSPREGELTANQYIAEDGKQAVLFVLALAAIPATYRLTRIDDKLVEKQQTLSGSYLMNHGLNFRLVADFDSTSVMLERVE